MYSMVYITTSGEEESKKIEKSLKEMFDFGSWKDENYYWEPLSKTQNTIPTIYFEEDLFKVEALQIIVNILK